MFLKKIFNKKRSVYSLLVLYVFSYFLNSLFFVNWKSVFAEDPIVNVNLVAVVVDKDLYWSLSSDIKWYAQQYVQKNVTNWKAIVLSLNVNDDDEEKFEAKDIVKI